MSIQSKLEKSTITARYKLFDLQVKLMGKPAHVTRIKAIYDMYGDTLEDPTVILDSAIEVIMNYPSEIPVNRLRNSTTEVENSESGIFLYDILPIEAYVKYSDNFQKGDIVVDIIEDENFENIKVLLRVSEELVSPGSVGLVYRKLHLAPFNGILTDEIQSIVDAL